MTDETNGAVGGKRIGKGNKELEEICPRDAISTIVSTWTELGLKPGHHRQKSIAT
jgi:hypothetical protein